MSRNTKSECVAEKCPAPGKCADKLMLRKHFIYTGMSDKVGHSHRLIYLGKLCKSLTSSFIF